MIDKYSTGNKYIVIHYIDSLVQKCSISIVNALEILQWTSLHNASIAVLNYVLDIDIQKYETHLIVLPIRSTLFAVLNPYRFIVVMASAACWYCCRLRQLPRMETSRNYSKIRQLKSQILIFTDQFYCIVVFGSCAIRLNLNIRSITFMTT